MAYITALFTVIQSIVRTTSSYKIHLFHQVTYLRAILPKLLANFRISSFFFLCLNRYHLHDREPQWYAKPTWELKCAPEDTAVTNCLYTTQLCRVSIAILKFYSTSISMRDCLSCICSRQASQSYAVVMYRGLPWIFSKVHVGDSVKQ